MGVQSWRVSVLQVSLFFQSWRVSVLQASVLFQSQKVLHGSRYFCPKGLSPACFSTFPALEGLCLAGFRAFLVLQSLFVCFRCVPVDVLSVHSHVEYSTFAVCVLPCRMSGWVTSRNRLQTYGRELNFLRTETTHSSD